MVYMIQIHHQLYDEMIHQGHEDYQIHFPSGIGQCELLDKFDCGRCFCPKKFGRLYLTDKDNWDRRISLVKVMSALTDDSSENSK